MHVQILLSNHGIGNKIVYSNKVKTPKRMKYKRYILSGFFKTICFTVARLIDNSSEI